ncbi:TPA_asm: hypothetical protein HUJ06_031951 [Nelumbo nucifera]|uniref:Uncharacterized protein n=1 Tax=Nelumbo nucifera TaxID=4432 RepID=A0A822ZJ58_NELNU|nr:TPA_asm: hypothetical protein HUJ06_003401 [Nelumbo nucifera]DAD45172.1 TPA_asm: hypothetical protein HUJ06_003402 [Nelumbo nucifera]DAD45528.1 TPA_asm: hypothetical protein HUJ06_003758 [Nelumbo nucifera]DAD45806.1 TPA_asm: hypothetical protein HUJ06_004036 [Nelumbo nucifera]DAD46369.1 TPA_asm: hypothetical protein HUJ06_004599 [Nelumbo nucifera]
MRLLNTWIDAVIAMDRSLIFIF